MACHIHLTSIARNYGSKIVNYQASLNPILWQISTTNQKLTRSLFARHVVTSPLNLSQQIVTRTEDAMTSGTKKSPARAPFVKNLLIGEYDNKMQEYPEVLDKQNYEDIHSLLGQVQEYMEENVASREIDKNGFVPTATIQGLKDLGIFGLQIPQIFCGRGLSMTECARIWEALAVDGSVATLLEAHHTLGIKGLLLAGNASQQARYLPQLATGELTATLALWETNAGTDLLSMEASAEPVGDGSSWKLNGTKTWVCSGNTSDLFTVFAKTKVMNKKTEKMTEKISAFLVDREFGGIDVGERETTLGLKGAQMYTVKFNDVIIPKENVLGEIGKGLKLAKKIVSSSHLTISSLCVGSMRHLLDKTITCTQQRQQFGEPLSSFSHVQDRLAKVSRLLYSADSLLYHATALVDLYEDQDCEVEAAITKVFCSEALWQSVYECQQLIGMQSYVQGNELPHERMLRDARSYMLFGGINEILKLTLATSAVQFAGKHMSDSVMKMRNMLQHPDVMFPYYIKKNILNFTPKLNLDIKGYLHLSFKTEANQLESHLAKFKAIVFAQFHRCGTDIVQEQVILERIADILIEFYLQTAVLGRASRAYCTAFPLSNHDVTIGQAICTESDLRMKVLLHKFEENTIIPHGARTAKLLLNEKRYPISHPIYKEDF